MFVFVFGFDEFDEFDEFVSLVVVGSVASCFFANSVINRDICVIDNNIVVQVKPIPLMVI